MAGIGGGRAGEDGEGAYGGGCRWCKPDEEVIDTAGGHCGG